MIHCRNSSLLTFSAGHSRRWYGRKLFSTTIGGGVSWQRPVGKRGQVRFDGNVAHVTNRRNAPQTADDFTLAAKVDRAFSARRALWPVPA